jgi:Tol biopolymer transport system component
MYSSGDEMSAHCSSPSISGDGRFVTFCTQQNLTSDDLNAEVDVYVRDLRMGITTLESKSTAGVSGNGDSGTDWWGIQMVAPSLSADGRYVAFFSEASNLVPGDTNSARDVFVRDRLAGTTTRVSVSSTGAQGDDESLVPVISANGRFVAFQSFATNLGGPDSHSFYDVFRHDRWTGRTIKLTLAPDGSEGDGDSGGGGPTPIQGLAISADGRWIAFQSNATNLVLGGITSYVGHIYVRDCLTEQTYIASVSVTGVEADAACRRPSLSGDGRFVSFESAASNLVAGDTNQVRDVFVKDMLTGAVHRVSVSSTGAEGDSDSWLASITPDGRHVGFFSYASNLDPVDGDGLAGAFVHDTWTGVTRLVCVNSFGVKSNNDSGPASTSADGRTVVFKSAGTNLVLGDTHVNWDVFVHHMPPRGSSVANYCPSTPNSTGQDARIEYTGAFQLSATNLVLTAGHCPTSRLGLFFYGDAQAQLPFGAGWRCVGGSLHRLPLVHTSAAGTAQFALGPLLEAGGTGIQPGSTWNFQFVFRDSTGGAAPDLNLSDAMSATFAP